MGWDVPKMYIERALDSDPPETTSWYLIAKPWNMFATLENSKAFLLGHGKYGPQPGWEPARELKGLPKNPSIDVARLLKTPDHEVTDATWLTLTELESIDLDEAMGLPNDIDPILHQPGRYFHFSRFVDGEEEHIDSIQLDDKTIRAVIEQNGGAEHENGMIRATRWTRRHYAHNFETMLDFMGELCEGGRYGKPGRSADQIRLLIWMDH